MEYFAQLFADREIRKREKWLLGDFNVNLEARNSAEAILVNRFLKNNSCRQLITTHTRLSNRGGSCIDWVITDCPYVNHSGIMDELLSDHFTIFAIRKKDHEKVWKVWKKVRIQKNFDKEVFCTLLLNSDWNQYYAIRDVDLLWNIVISRILEILEIMCPYKNVCLRDPKTPWITPAVVNAINERKKYVRMYWRTKKQYILEICKYLRNRCNTLVRNAKSYYIKANLVRNANNPKKFWKTINNLLKGPKKEIIIHEYIDNVGKIIPRGETCDFLNEYYVNIGRANLVEETPLPEWQPEDEGYVFDPVTLQEVLSLIKDIDTHKDSCIDGVSTCVLKESFCVLAMQIRYLFNVSLEECKFPRKWAKGYINILPKGGNLKDPSNWRPITQTLLPAKMLERIVQCRFFSILCDSNILSEHQYGFIPGRSTQLAIFDILKEIFEARNSKLDTGLLFLDDRKAFDSLDHNILLTKLQGLGASGKMLNWFCSYLNRTQCVRHSGQVSTELKFKCGIPQGSCLGPTLFIFYINDVFRYIGNDINIMMFADDCVLYKSDIICDTILECLQKGLDNYVSWGRDNNMYLNASKTKSMLIKPTIQYNLYQPLSTEGKNIQFVNMFNYLGVLLDDQMTFTPYYNLVKRRIENKIFVLSKIRKFVDSRTALLVYKQAILPLAEYAGFVLISCNIGQRHDLQTLQNNALRLCKRYHLLDRIQIEQLHDECTILGLEQRRRKQLLRLMYLHSKNEDNIKKPVRVTRLETKLVFKTPAKCTTKYLNSPFYKGTLLWNGLSSELQRSDSVERFVNNVKKLYIRYQEIW